MGDVRFFVNANRRNRYDESILFFVIDLRLPTLGIEKNRLRRLKQSWQPVGTSGSTDRFRPEIYWDRPVPGSQNYSSGLWSGRYRAEVSCTRFGTGSSFRRHRSGQY